MSAQLELAPLYDGSPERVLFRTRSTGSATILLRARARLRNRWTKTGRLRRCERIGLRTARRLLADLQSVAYVTTTRPDWGTLRIEWKTL